MPGTQTPPGGYNLTSREDLTMLICLYAIIPCSETHSIN